MESKYSIGIDVHRRSWSVAGSLGKEIVFQQRQDPSCEVLVRSLKRRDMLPSNTQIAYEAGPTGYRLWDELTAQGFEVLVVSPAQIPRAPGQRVKTDSRDCRDLALKLEAGVLKGIAVPSVRERAIRDLVRTRRQLVDERSSILRMIKSKLLFLGIDYGKRRRWGARYRAYLLELALDPGHREAIVHLVAVVDVLTSQIEGTESELDGVFSAAEYQVRRAILESVPGIGRRGSAVILGEIRDFGRFPTAGHFASYLGLTPSEHSSGDTIRRGRITRQGNGHVRTVLTEAAWLAIRTDPRLRMVYERHRIRMGTKRAVVAVARKMAVMIWRMLQTGEVYRRVEG